MTDRTDTRGQKTVLIVEDHAPTRHALRDFLDHAFPDCGFREAADGASALKACNAHQPQLVLMDIGLPDDNGIELTARLGTLYPGIRVIVVSQESAEVYVEHALAAGACAHVCKDNLATDLIPAVAAALGISPATDRGAW